MVSAGGKENAPSPEAAREASPDGRPASPAARGPAPAAGQDAGAARARDPKAEAGLRWVVWDDAEVSRHWDERLAAFKDHHVRQCRAWGEHKRGGWEPVYTALFNGANPLVMGLCLVRRLPAGAATVVWINGGPAFRKLNPPTQDLPSLKSYLQGLKEHFTKRRRLVIRLNSHLPMDLGAQLVVRQEGFARPLMPLGTGLTYFVDLRKPLEELRGGLEKNWRNQLRQAEKAAPVVDIGRDRRLLERYLPIHNDMCLKKGLPQQRLTLERLETMARQLGERIVFFVVSAEGRDGCGGALWTFGSKAYFALSATNDWGRKHCLPNMMFWRAIAYFKEAGGETLDVTGLDPSGSWSVFNFKRGLNATPVEYLGEWEWSPSPWLRRAFNLALWGIRDRMP